MATVKVASKKDENKLILVENGAGAPCSHFVFDYLSCFYFFSFFDFLISDLVVC